MEITKLYNGEIELSSEPIKHLYFIGDKKVSSVTGILGCISKPALTWWSAEVASGHWIEFLTKGVYSLDKDDRKKVIRVIEGVWDVPSIDEITLQDNHTKARFAHYNAKKSAADIGTLGHKWCEQYIKGENPITPVNPQLKAITDAFLEWMKNNKVEFLKSEIKIYSKKYNYAGTMDFEAMVNGKLVLGDIKTSGAIYPEMRMQTAAYRQTRQEETGQIYDHQLIIRLGKFPKEDGTPDFEVSEFNEFEKDIRGFIGALILSNRLSEYKDEEAKCK